MQNQELALSTTGCSIQTKQNKTNHTDLSFLHSPSLTYLKGICLAESECMDFSDLISEFNMRGAKNLPIEKSEYML